MRTASPIIIERARLKDGTSTRTLGYVVTAQIVPLHVAKNIKLMF